VDGVTDKNYKESQMSNRIDQLEYTVMELGTEIFRLKSQISEMSSVQENMSKTLKNLKDVLDDKGVICEDDFDAASPGHDDGEMEEGDHIDLSFNHTANKPEFH
jgi:regulator of replication initiation timing